MKTFGEILKNLRIERGLTQVQLANILCLDKSTIAKYETDRIEPSVSMIKELAKFFQVTTDYLLGLTEL